MTKPTTGEQQSTDKSKEAMTLDEAVSIVREVIVAKEDHLRRIAKGEEYAPISLSGATPEGYPITVMVEHSDKAAQIMLDYRYPVYTVLWEKGPQAMWNELARMVGVAKVFSVDLQL